MFIPLLILFISIGSFIVGGFYIAKLILLGMSIVLFALWKYGQKNSDYRFLNPIVIFSLVYIQYYFLGPITTFYTSGYLELSTVIYGNINALNQNFLDVAVFVSFYGLLTVAISYYISLKIFKHSSKNILCGNFNYHKVGILVILSGFISMIFILLFFNKVGFINFIETERSLRYFLYAQASNYGFFIDFISTSYLFSTIYFIGSVKNKYLKWISLLLINVLFIYFNIIIFSGSRITIIRPVLIILFYYSLINELKFLISGGLIFISIFLFGIYRQFMSYENSLQMTFEYIEKFNTIDFYNILIQSFDFTTVYDIFIMLTNFSFDFSMGDTYLKILYQFIPREIWVDKPENVTIMMTKLFRPEQFDIGVSYNPSILGEMYYNFADFGVIVGCILVGTFLAFLTNFGNRAKQSNYYSLIYAVMLVLIIEEARGAFSNITTTYLVFYILPSLFCISRGKKSKSVLA